MIRESRKQLSKTVKGGKVSNIIHGMVGIEYLGAGLPVYEDLIRVI